MRTTTVAYHWIMTVQAGSRQITGQGVVNLPPDYTRQEVYQDVLSELQRMAGTASVSVTFFALQPNSLAA